MPLAEELREQYAAMPLEALLDLHTRDDLTEVARATLAGVLSERGVTAESVEALSTERRQERRAEQLRREPDGGQLAPYGSRLAARLIDLAIVASLITFFGWLSTASYPAVFFIGLIAGLAYHLLADGLPGGQSLGKRALGIAVVDAVFGSPCTFGQSAGRNFMLNFLGFIDILFIASKRRQRVGDFVADTVVVRRHGPS